MSARDHLDDLEDGLPGLIDEARRHVEDVRAQLDDYEQKLADLEQGVAGVRPAKVEANVWILFQPFTQGARIDSARKALRAAGVLDGAA